MDNITLYQWLDLPCLEEEVKGDPHTGYYLGIEILRKKIKFMETEFNVTVNYSNFHHFLFNRMDKKVFASGSIQLDILTNNQFTIDGTFVGLQPIKRLVGAYSFDIEDYDNEKDHNEQYAGTLKSLCIGNALGNEYPQFGSLLNQKELVRTLHSKRIGRTSSKVTDFQKQL